MHCMDLYIASDGCTSVAMYTHSPRAAWCVKPMEDAGTKYIGG